ncbi:MAG: hypothetical protein BECKG1743D_GA0114223_105454, partial [Candidatus Kentron sp. G]
MKTCLFERSAKRLIAMCAGIDTIDMHSAAKPQRVSWFSRDRYRYRYSLSKKPDRIDS